MHKLPALLLILVILTGVIFTASCNKDSDAYPPVESSEEEARVLMTFTADGKKHELRYELYRALFCNLYEETDRTPEEEERYLSALDEKVVKTAAGIFSVIAEAKKIGHDVMGAEGDEFVRNAISDAVGDGSYDEYLQALSAISMNYAVADLMFRYSLALSETDDYYLGSEDDTAPTVGKLTYTDEAVSAFYASGECARVLKAFLPSDVKTKADAKAFSEKLAAKETDLDAALYIVGNTLSEGSEIIHPKTHTVTGSIIAKYGTESVYFSAVSDAALALAPGEVSDVIFAAGESQAGYYILRGLEKDSVFLADHFDEIAASYLENELGKRLDAAKVAMLTSCVKEPLYSDLDRAALIRGRK